MAAFETAAPAPFGAVAVLRFNNAVESVYVAVRDWHLRRRTVRELSRLSRAQLADIGLEGMSLEDVARGLRP